MKGFSKTQFPNLIRNDGSGIYYVRTRVGNGRRVARSLDTDLLSIAKLKLGRVLAELRANAGRVSGGNVTLGECAALFLQRKKLHGRNGRQLAPRAFDYRRETVEAWRRAIPGFDQYRVALLRPEEYQTWVDRVRAKYRWTRFNGMMETMRGVLAEGVVAGALERNPAEKFMRARRPAGGMEIPDPDMFGKILWALDQTQARRWARLSVRGLAFTALRPNEARHVTRADVDLDARTIRARVTKNGEPRTVNLSDQAAEFFAAEGVDQVLAAWKKSPRKALATIARELKIQRLVPYTFRHLHLTRLLESGVDILAAAAAAGHRDRGRTLLGSYAHARPEHVRAVMKKVVI